MQATSRRTEHEHQNGTTVRHRKAIRSDQDPLHTTICPIGVERKGSGFGVDRYKSEQVRISRDGVCRGSPDARAQKGGSFGFSLPLLEDQQECGHRGIMLGVLRGALNRGIGGRIHQGIR